MAGARVSIVIPAYNAEAFLGASIRSALDQTLPPMEVIVVDDGSTDGTRNVSTAFGDRVRYIYQPNAGVSAARNRGIREARGEWIAFLDADDIFLPEKLETQMNDLMAHPEAILSASSYWIVSPAKQRRSSGTTFVSDPVAELRERNCLCTSTIVVRRDVLLRAGLFRLDLQTCEDWDLWFRLAKLGPMRLLDEHLLLYRVVEGSLSSASDRVLNDARRILKDGALWADLPKSSRWWLRRRLWARQLYSAALMDRNRPGWKWAGRLLASFVAAPFGRGLPPRSKVLLAGVWSQFKTSPVGRTLRDLVGSVQPSRSQPSGRF